MPERLGDAQETTENSETYEPPRLTLVGNLRDILAGTGTIQCDGAGVPGNLFPSNQCH